MITDFDTINFYRSIVVELLYILFQVLQAMTVVGGILLIALFPTQDTAVFYGTGGALIGVGVLVTVYEVIMITLALVKKVNHPTRLLVVSYPKGLQWVN